MGSHACVACGHDPSCGLASLWVNGQTLWLCHDDDHSCYASYSVPADSDPKWEVAIDALGPVPDGSV